MKKILLFILRFLFKIDVEKLLCQLDELKSEIQILSGDLNNSTEKISTQYEKITLIGKLNDDLTQRFEQLITQKVEVERKCMQLQASSENLHGENLHLLHQLQNKQIENIALKEKNNDIQKSDSDKDEKIKELIKKDEENINKSNKHNQEIILLKELISSYQSNEKSTNEKISLNNKLHDEVVELKKKNKLLIAEFESYKKAAKTVQHVKSSKSIQQLSDGSLIEHENMIFGERTVPFHEFEANRFEYIGHFLFDLQLYYQKDHIQFPSAFFPKKETKILKWHNSSSTETKGICEPLLIKGMQQLLVLCPELEVLQNVILSIRNREYGYRPDIALYWEKYNLCVDIEIDEPYDILSRKPIHYIDSSDYLRNLYFISQGWIVIRFCEKQVFEKTEYCIQYIASLLSKITNDEVFNAIIEGFALETTDRWTYNQALEWANANYRESYLEIESSDTTHSIELEYSEFKGISPDVDILPEVDFSALVQKIEGLKNFNYLRITTAPYESQYVLKDTQIDINKFTEGVKGFDIVAEEADFLPFELIMEIEGLDSPFKYQLYHNSDGCEDARLYELVKEAIYNCNPIRIEYRDAKADITFRNLTYLSYDGDSIKYFCDNIWKNYYSQNGSKIQAYCELRNDLRNFYINRIQSIQVYNLHDFGIGHIIAFSAALWYPLQKNDVALSRHIATIIPKYIIETNPIAAGNYAHYLLLNGNMNDALEIYRKFEDKQVTDTESWKDLTMQDFDDLKEIADYREKIDTVIPILGWNKL